MPQKHSQQKQNPYSLRTLLDWKAPGRPYKKHSKEYFMSVILIAFLIEIILFLFSQYAFMLVVLSLTFLSLVLAATPPRDFQYRISTEGIMVEDHFFLWNELYDFYFKKYQGLDVLHIRTYALMPGELTITLGELTPQEVRQTLIPYLPFREYVKPSMMEQSADWLSKNFPLEKE